MSVQTTTPGKAVNEASPKLIKTRSQFDLSYKHFDTHRFGEYHPHFYFEGVPDDKNITLNSSHTLRSYTLGAPLMQDIQLKKDYFGVPLSAILPINWEKWYKNPNRGDDVSDEVGPCVTQFWIKVGSFCRSLLTAFRAGIRTDGAFNSPSSSLTAWFRMMAIFEMFYSNGSLLKTMGISGSQFFSYVNISTVGGTGIRDFDFYFDTWINYLQEYMGITELYVVDSSGNGYYVDFDGHVQNGELAVRHLTLNGFLSLLRDDLNLTISSVTYSSSIVPDDDEFMALVAEFVLDTTNEYISIYSGDEEAHAIDLSRIFAYQISCAHFYSNENVDDIYSAELYRELIKYLLYGGSIFLTSTVFSYNGMNCYYDSCSGAAASLAFSVSGDYASNFLISTASADVCRRGYFSNVFSFRRSLKFMDYFTGARTQPLAVGDSTVAVNSSKVNVIDMASGFQKTRFWNAVSRTGSKIRNYMREVMGVELPSDIHDPYFLGHTSDSVFGQEVENTAEGQLTLANSVTSVLRSNASRYAFNFDVDVPISIIGITYYDIPRIYTQSTDRVAIGSSRFDKFNPFLQFIGDQPLYNLELGNTYENNTFGYQLRDMQYKQKFPIGTGGFVNQLPGFCFKADDTRYGDFSSINEEYVRSLQSELDKYYVSLTGHSLGTYFHFIVKNDNKCTASRPMAYAPSIL